MSEGNGPTPEKPKEAGAETKPEDQKPAEGPVPALPNLDPIAKDATNLVNDPAKLGGALETEQNKEEQVTSETMSKLGTETTTVGAVKDVADMDATVLEQRTETTLDAADAVDDNLDQMEDDIKKQEVEGVKQAAAAPHAAALQAGEQTEALADKADEQAEDEAVASAEKISSMGNVIPTKENKDEPSVFGDEVKEDKKEKKEEAKTFKKEETESKKSDVIGAAADIADEGNDLRTDLRHQESNMLHQDVEEFKDVQKTADAVTQPVVDAQSPQAAVQALQQTSQLAQKIESTDQNALQTAAAPAAPTPGSAGGAAPGAPGSVPNPEVLSTVTAVNPQAINAATKVNDLEEHIADTGKKQAEQGGELLMKENAKEKQKLEKFADAVSDQPAQQLDEADRLAEHAADKTEENAEEKFDQGAKVAEKNLDSVSAQADAVADVVPGGGAEAAEEDKKQYEDGWQDPSVKEEQKRMEDSTVTRHDTPKSDSQEDAKKLVKQEEDKAAKAGLSTVQGAAKLADNADVGKAYAEEGKKELGQELGALQSATKEVDKDATKEVNEEGQALGATAPAPGAAAPAPAAGEVNAAADATKFGLQTEQNAAEAVGKIDKEAAQVGTKIVDERTELVKDKAVDTTKAAIDTGANAVKANEEDQYAKLLKAEQMGAKPLDESVDKATQKLDKAVDKAEDASDKVERVAHKSIEKGKDKINEKLDSASDKLMGFMPGSDQDKADAKDAKKNKVKAEWDNLKNSAEDLKGLGQGSDPEAAGNAFAKLMEDAFNALKVAATAVQNPTHALQMATNQAKDVTTGVAMGAEEAVSKAHTTVNSGLEGVKKVGEMGKNAKDLGEHTAQNIQAKAKEAADTPKDKMVEGAHKAIDAGNQAWEANRGKALESLDKAQGMVDKVQQQTGQGMQQSQEMIDNYKNVANQLDAQVANKAAPSELSAVVKQGNIVGPSPAGKQIDEGLTKPLADLSHNSLQAAAKMPPGEEQTAALNNSASAIVHASSAAELSKAATMDDTAGKNIMQELGKGQDMQQVTQGLTAASSALTNGGGGITHQAEQAMGDIGPGAKEGFIPKPPVGPEAPAPGGGGNELEAEQKESTRMKH